MGKILDTIKDELKIDDRVKLILLKQIVDLISKKGISYYSLMLENKYIKHYLLEKFLEKSILELEYSIINKSIMSEFDNEGVKLYPDSEYKYNIKKMEDVLSIRNIFIKSGDKENDDYFHLYCKEIFVPTLSALLSQYKNSYIDINQFLNFAGTLRNDVAKHTDDEYAFLMGRRIDIENADLNISFKELMIDPTGYNPKWSGWKNKILELINTQNNNPQSSLKLGSVEDKYAKSFIEYTNANALGIKKGMHGEVDTVLYGDFIGATYVFRNDNKEKSLYCVHQPGTNLGLNKIDVLIKDIVNDDHISKEKLTECLAKILWHLYHGSYFHRGQAAIGENIAKALAKFSGYELNFPDKSSVKGENMNLDHHVLSYLNVDSEYINHCANYFDLMKTDELLATGLVTENSD